MKKIALITVLGFAIIFPVSGGNAGHYTKHGILMPLYHHDEYYPEDNNQAKQVYTCSMHPDVIQDKPGKCPKCGMNLIQKDTGKDQYTCPMHPGVISDKAGKCPECGMNLVKKETAKMEYTCPMHSDVLSNKAGKCPKCGMSLVPKTTNKLNTAVK